MARIYFENPNEPEQPAGVVYRCYCRIGSKKVTLYFGNARAREEHVSAPCILKRGNQEAQRSCLSSDPGKLLDTDFIVGTVLKYIKSRGHDCYWRHVDGDPRKEKRFCG
jgi:hypothetical protein